MSTTTLDELLLASSEVEIQATAGKPPSVSIVAYTGGLMTVPGWGPVAIDLAGLDAGAEQISLLADHDATLDGIVGHGQAAITNGKLLVNGTITGATEAARQVVELAKGGFKFQASVGVVPSDYERVRPNDTDRRDIINDDLGLFDETARNLGWAAMRSLSDLVFQVLLANAGNFFSGGHANYDTGPATALSSASLGAGIAKMISPSDFCLV